MELYVVIAAILLGARLLFGSFRRPARKRGRRHRRL